MRQDLGLTHAEAENYEAAVKWFRSAADQGNTEAQYALGVFYDQGYGVAKNYVEAHKWFVLASSSGHAGAAARIEENEILLSAEQIAEGQRLAAEFKPKKESE